MSWLITNIKLNKLEWFSTVDKGASGDETNRAKIVLWKRDKSQEIKKEESNKMTLEELLPTLPEEAQQVIMAAIEAAKTPVEPAPMPEPEPLPEEAQKQIEAAEGEKKEMEAEKMQLAKRVKELEDKQKLIELQKRAENDFGNVPMSAIELAKVLKEADEGMSEGSQKALTEMLGRVHKGMEESPILKQYGSDNEGGVETAIEKKNRLVKEAMEKDSKLTSTKAEHEIFKRNKGLYAEVQAEEKGA